jgi:AcrR family transcriptional regulator
VTASNSAPATARAVARRELTRAILDEARRQLTKVGPAALSVRAVARELGMASSAVYRYFATRDELITAMLVISYDDLGSVAEAADAGVRHRSDLPTRWLALTRAVRGWAREHPHDYALLYGSPVPGYAAPEDTIVPATRVIRVILDLVADAATAADPTSPRPSIPRTARRAVASARAFAGPAFSDEMIYRGLGAWSGLLGSLTLELFGHLHNAVDDYDAWFDQSMRRIAPI